MKIDTKKLGRISALVIGVMLLGIIVMTSFYHTTEDQYAVVTTLGKPALVEHSGLHFKLPLIQRKTIISKNIRGIPIGYDAAGESIESESVMITRDYNFVDVDFYVEWKVTDPVKYLYASADPENILKMITQSYIRDTIGLFTTGKSEIQASIKSKIADRIEKEDLGIALVNITMQDAEPPTTEVQNAFKAVETAKQGAETATNNADKYKNQVIPGAQATADEAVQKAEAYKQAKINEANAQAQRFNDLYTEYARYPEITRQRLFFEAMGDILPDIRVIIKSQGDDIHTYMPVDILGGTQTVTGEEAAQ